jgi:cytochrome b6-f complex iron-sulfur subunit
MSNYQVEPAGRPQALSKEAIKALRKEQVQGVSRRQVLRTALGVGLALFLAELGAGTIGFIWPAIATGNKSKVLIGTFSDVKAQNSSLPIKDGFPAYYSAAKAYVILIDPSRQEFVPGADAAGDGTDVNVRALYQRCPHLGCKPNPCLKNFWFECPCHGSRYDRLGIKALGAQYGPAPRSMDRFAVSVDGGGALSVDTLKITLGPLPIALGQPGLIPPLSPTGCL